MAEAAAQFLHFGRHGGRVKQGLVLSGDMRHNPFDIWHKTHVQHAIRFVEHQKLHAFEADHAIAQMVESDRGGHENVDATAQGHFLGAGFDSAINGGTFDAHKAAVVFDGDINLFRQFAGGGDNQRLGFGSTWGEHLQNGQGKSGGFAGASLGTANYVFALQQQGNGFFLNRGGGLITHGH